MDAGNATARANPIQKSKGNGRTLVRPARSREELEEAYRLVYDSYRQQGYLARNRAKMRLTLFNAFPDTATFVALEGQEVVGTVSVVADTDIGLPMDEVYGEELLALRRSGRRLSEVTMLATTHQRMSRRLPLFLQLMQQVFDYIRVILQADDACLTCHPHHTGFYEKRLLFEGIGEEKSYGSVQGNPALAMRLDFRTVRDRYSQDARLWRTFYEDRTPPRELARRHRMTPEDLRYFFARRTDIFQNASAHQIEVLRLLYPECPWHKWAGSGMLHPVRTLGRSCSRLGAGLAHGASAAWAGLACLLGAHPTPSPSAGPSADTTLH